jgi:biotin carboxyl carrier protein
MIVAPGVGVFSPVEIDEGSAVEQGDVVGEIVGPGTRVAIRSPFRGTVMGMMAHPGERLREGQPIAWLRVA